MPFRSALAPCPATPRRLRGVYFDDEAPAGVVVYLMYDSHGRRAARSEIRADLASDATLAACRAWLDLIDPPRHLRPL